MLFAIQANNTKNSKANQVKWKIGLILYYFPEACRNKDIITGGCFISGDDLDLSSCTMEYTNKK